MELHEGSVELDGSVCFHSAVDDVGDVGVKCVGEAVLFGRVAVCGAQEFDGR